MTLESVTCNSFPWNKAGDFMTPILLPNMDKNKIDAARDARETARATLHPNKGIFKLKKSHDLLFIIIIMVKFIGKIIQCIYQHHCGHSLGNVD